MSTQTQTLLVVGIIIIALLIAGVYFFSSLQSPFSTATTTPQGNATTTPATSTPPSNTATSTATTSPTFTRVQIAFLDIAGSSTGKVRGCDKVVLVPFTVATTTTPLTSALKTLFSINTTTVSGYFNFLDRTNGTLTLDRATVLSGTANIYLKGSLTGLAGVCDDPRARIQIEETALVFPSIERVQLYLNGEPTTLTPSQQ